MTREEKATLRAEARRRRRNPRDEEQLDGDQPARADEQQQDEQQQDEEPRREQRTRPKRELLHGAAGEELANAATQARELLRAVRGVDAESVSAIERTQNGWKVSLEVVELRRIPESTDVLASYEVELDGNGKFLGFSQGRRYHRSQAEVGAGR